MKTELPRKLGWIPDLPDRRDFRFKATIPSASLPKLYQLVWVPMPLDQLSLGSCTVNAIAGAVHFDRIKHKKLNAFSPSRLQMYYDVREMHG